ncbi:CDP-alcohol phosphatidyltransferase family protein [Thioalkalivibrio sp. ALJ16]|uniref:CDP-alcohol phosphatidyltransferase family protein n=1 Tax=Thioalkalivibrio sp. ALJ16 TaxID=1158762 RepID=UPI00039A9067|nr:CDP-alcohol phosphatidyltransferase family protein [Thioalkalivibrio sp. ALJ16]
MISSDLKPYPGARLRNGARTWAADWVLAGLCGLGVTLALQAHTGLSGPALPLAYGLLWLGLGGLLAGTTPVAGLLPGRRGPGPANRITLLRASLTVPLAALVLTAPAADTLLALWIIALAAVALLLDGVDGAVARRSGSSTAYGARFDMELDAAMILALALLAWQLTPVGPWVVLIGLMRYAFVLAARPWPWLAASLPPSRRRQAICVLQTVVLLLVLTPALPAAAASAVALGGLLALTLSFAVDIHWLYHHSTPADGGAQ